MNDPHILDSALGSSLLTGDSSNLLSNLQAQLTWLLWIGTGVSIIVALLFIVSLIHKMRVQSAILRIDKNLQRLVDVQVPAAEEAAVPAPVDKTLEIAAQQDIEQK